MWNIFDLYWWIGAIILCINEYCYFQHIWVLTAGLSWVQYMYVLFMTLWCREHLSMVLWSYSCGPLIFLHSHVLLIVFFLEHLCLLPAHHSQQLIIVYCINSCLMFWTLLAQICLTWLANLQDWKAFWKVDSGIFSGNLF